MSSRNKWYVKMLKEESNELSEWQLLNNVTEDEKVISAAPVESYCFSLDACVVPLLDCRNLRALILPAPMMNMQVTNFRPLLNFAQLEELQLNSIDVSELVLQTWSLPRLQMLVLNCISLSATLIEWISGHSTLQCLKICDCVYNGDLVPLIRTEGLKELVLTGQFSSLSNNSDFVTMFKRLNALTLEIACPDERCLKALGKSRALIHLILRETNRHSQMLSLCSIQNLASVVLFVSSAFEIPTAFRNLQKLRSLMFIDVANVFDQINGLENVTVPLPELVLDLKYPSLDFLRYILSLFSHSLTALSLTTDVIPGELGLDQCENLQSLEIHAKKHFHEDTFDEIRSLNHLKHLGIGGYLNVEAELEQILPVINLSSLTIRNGFLTSSGLNVLSEQQGLKILTLQGCLLNEVDTESFPFFPFLKKLNLVHCSPVDEYDSYLLQLPQFVSLNSLDLVINIAVPEIMRREHFTNTNVIPLKLFFRNHRE